MIKIVLILISSMTFLYSTYKMEDYLFFAIKKLILIQINNFNG